MSLKKRVEQLELIGYKIKRSSRFDFAGKSELVEQLASEMIDAIEELAERIEKLEGEKDGEN